MTRELTDLEALDALAWQIELGADEAMSEEPINRLETLPEPQKTTEVETKAEATVKPQEVGPSDQGAAQIAKRIRRENLLWVVQDISWTRCWPRLI